MAYILVNTVDEFKGMNPRDVVQYIEGEPLIGVVPVEPGMTNSPKDNPENKGQRVVGFNSENAEINEGLVRFDIVFYVSRLISSQKERDFVNTNYNDIRRVFSIWVCMNLDVSGFGIARSIGAETFEGIPAGVGGCVLYAFHEFFLKFGILALSAVFFEQGAHRAVAFSERMNVLNRNHQHDGIVEHVSDIEVVVRVGDDKEVIGIIIVIVAIFDIYGVSGVDRQDEVVKTTVAEQSYRTGKGKLKVVDVVMIIYHKMNVNVGIADIGVLHIGEKLLIELIIKLMRSHAKRFQRQLIGRKLTHIGV